MTSSIVRSESCGALLRRVALSPSAPVPGVSTLAGRFRLMRRLGGGSFGTVYEAVDTQDARRIALKLLREPEPRWLTRFKQEFRSLQGLVHPNLVMLEDLFGHDDCWFFTMELVDGVYFSKYVRRDMCDEIEEGINEFADTVDGNQCCEARAYSRTDSTFDEGRLRSGLRQVFEGLSLLHSIGKVHRDIKPSNVLVTRTGRVVVIDFGLVKEEARKTDSFAAGTPAYMAPEQAASTTVGAPADLYAVGVMLYEVLTGSLPVEGAPLQILIEKQAREIRPPSSLNPLVPSDLDTLCTRLLKIAPNERPSADEALKLLGASALAGDVSPRERWAAARFVGRAPELRELWAAFGAVARTGAATLLVTGESGIGKSRLVKHFVSQVLEEHPALVFLGGCCHERESIPYMALDGVIEALGRFLSRLPRGEAEALIPAQHAELVQAFPALLRVSSLSRSHSTRELEGSPLEIRRQAFACLRELLGRLCARGPVVIFVDDFQWADEDSLAALRELTRTPATLSLLLIGAVRFGMHPEPRPLERLASTFGCPVRVMKVLPLSHGEATELAVDLLGVQGDAAGRVASEAAGHPLFLAELARWVLLGRERGELTFDDLILSRVGELGTDARRLFELICLAAKPLSRKAAVTAMPCALESLRFSMTLLQTHGLVRRGASLDEETFEPSHDRIRDALVASLGNAAKRTLHEALAVALEESSCADSEMIALHWRESNFPQRALPHAASAGRQAMAALAFERATEWFEIALGLTGPNRSRATELHVELAEALAMGGRGAQAASHFLAATRDANGARVLELQQRAAEQLLRSGHFDRGMALSRQVLGALGLWMPRTTLGVLVALTYYGMLLKIRGLGFRERPFSEVPSRLRAQATACWSLGLSLSFVSMLVGILFLRRALLFALRTGDLEHTVSSLAMLAGFAHGSERAAAKLLIRTQELAQQSGSRRSRAFAAIAGGPALYASGQFTLAEKKLAEAMRVLQEVPNGLAHEEVCVRVFWLMSLSYLGRFNDMMLCREAGLRDAAARGDVYATVTLKTGAGSLVRLAQDRPDLVEIEATEALRVWSRRGFHLEHLFVSLGRVWASLYTDRPEDACRIANELVDCSKRSLFWQLQTVRSRALYVHGLACLALAQRHGRTASNTIRMAERDAAALERQTRPWCRPFAAVLRAGVALQSGDAETCLVLLNRCATDFERQGLAVYAAATRVRAARLRGDTDSEHLAHYRAIMHAEQVVDPERLLAVFLPAFTQNEAEGVGLGLQRSTS